MSGVLRVTPEALQVYAGRVESEGAELVALVGRLPEVGVGQPSQVATADAHAHVTAAVLAMDGALAMTAARLRFSAALYAASDVENAVEISKVVDR